MADREHAVEDSCVSTEGNGYWKLAESPQVLPEPSSRHDMGSGVDNGLTTCLICEDSKPIQKPEAHKSTTRKECNDQSEFEP